MPYFGEPIGRVKIQTSKNSQRYYTTKRLIRDLSSNTPNWYARQFRGYLFLQGMRDRSMRSRTELGWEIQLIDWSTQETGLTGPLEYKYQIPREICTRLKPYLYSAKCSWIIKAVISMCQSLEQ